MSRSKLGYRWFLFTVFDIFLFHSIRQYLNISAWGRQNKPKFSEFMNKVHCHCSWIARVNEYPTMHNFGIPKHTQSIMALRLRLSISGNSKEKLHCWNIVNMSNLQTSSWWQLHQYLDLTECLCIHVVDDKLYKQCPSSLVYPFFSLQQAE